MVKRVTHLISGRYTMNYWNKIILNLCSLARLHGDYRDDNGNSNNNNNNGMQVTEAGND